jgi:hypothetical protein
MRRVVPVLFAVGYMWGHAPAQESKPPAQPSIEDVKKQIASYPPDDQGYELWRFWVFNQPPDVQKLFDEDSTKAAGYALYRKELERQGDASAEVERKSKSSTRTAKVGKSSAGTGF